MNSFRFSIFLAILYAAIILVSCASSDEIGRMRWELNELKKRTDSIEARLPSGGGEVTDLEESQKATAQAVSDLWIRTQELDRDLKRITGQVEEDRFSFDRKRETAEETRENLVSDVSGIKTAVEGLDKRVALLEQRGDIQAVPAQIPAGKKEKKEDAKPEQSEVKDSYMSAYEILKAGNSSKAREQFMAFIRNYSENEYTDNARFWIAESYYQEKSFEDAILAYEELFRKNPESDKIPGAMLKQGLSFYALKDKETGRLILENLVEKFPDSDQAATAMSRLKESGPAIKE